MQALGFPQPIAVTSDLAVHSHFWRSFPSRYGRELPSFSRFGTCFLDRAERKFFDTKILALSDCPA
jgi:hypothetical protein